MTRQTNYYNAVHWLNNNLIMCNDIPKIDESIWGNMRFNTYDEETETYTEIFQWFLTDCSESDVEYLERSFGLLFTYSEKLIVLVTMTIYLMNICRKVLIKGE